MRLYSKLWDNMEEITVQEFKEKLEAEKSNVLLLDVREPFEQYQSKIEYENSVLIPVDQLEDRLNEIEEHKDRQVVCMCRSGSRSANACKLLEKEGFSHVKNLKGGINEWAREIDSSLPVY
jgi:rhodanese-related sulfurtransferase